MEKISVKELKQLAESNLVLLIAPSGAGKTTLLTFMSSFTTVPILDADAIGYFGPSRDAWVIDLGALRKMGSYMRNGIIGGWSDNIGDVIMEAQQQGWLLVGWDLVPDERQRILDVCRQRFAHSESIFHDVALVERNLKQAMNIYRKFKFPYLLRSPEEVYRKSDFRWQHDSGRAPRLSDPGKVASIIKDAWTNFRDWAVWHLDKDITPNYRPEIERRLKSLDGRVSSQKGDTESVRDSKTTVSQTAPSGR